MGYIVLNEKGGQLHIPDDLCSSEQDAEEFYWQSLQSTVGHIEKLCLCYNEKEIPLDRCKYVQIKKIVKVKDLTSLEIK